ncbi:MAG: hypothetical protein ACE5FU_06195 [Nitrospinota bacterium]
MRYIFGLLLCWIVYFVLKEAISSFLKRKKGDFSMVQDPLCGLFIPISESFKKKVGRRYYHFCSRECFKKFKKKAQTP